MGEMEGRSISGHEESLDGTEVLRDRIWGGLVAFAGDGMAPLVW
jgi:hypothetical protein